jgi:hypothetical protein
MRRCQVAERAAAYAGRYFFVSFLPRSRSALWPSTMTPASPCSNGLTHDTSAIILTRLRAPHCSIRTRCLTVMPSRPMATEQRDRAFGNDRGVQCAAGVNGVPSALAAGRSVSAPPAAEARWHAMGARSSVSAIQGSGQGCEARSLIHLPRAAAHLGQPDHHGGRAVDDGGDQPRASRHEDGRETLWPPC